MDSTPGKREPLQPREADARLRARVRRVSLLWWAATYVILCLLDFTTEPPKAWPTDLVGYAGGSLVGFGWSLLFARRLACERRLLRREAIWAGVGLAVLGGWACGAVVGVLDLCMARYLNLEAPAAVGFAASAGNYAELCVGWCFIYLVASGADRLARIEEEVSALRVVAYDSQSAVIRNEFRLDLLENIFVDLDKLLSLRRQAESQEVVLDVAAKLRAALDRGLDTAASAGRPEVNVGEAGGRDADFSAPDFVLRSVMNLSLANIVFWIAVYAFFIVAMEPYYVVSAGLKAGLSYSIGWLSFCTTGCLACMVLGRASAFLAGRKLWEKCTWAAVFSVAASYISAWVPWSVWGLLHHVVPHIQLLPAFAFYYGCAYAAWYCLYFYGQAVRREMSQRAVLAQAAEAAAAARCSMLRYQVRPHFLFNALNALYALIADRRWAAARAITRALSQYMERSFAEDERELVPIAEQVEALRAYLSIEKIRFGDRLHIRVDIPEQLAHACAPSLILQPLVENAMKYAVASTAEPVDVEIAADRVGDTLLLRVRDSGGDLEAPAAPGLGIGLRNVAARLASHYGERGLLQCKRLTPKGFVAEMRLPLEFACPTFAV